MTGRRMPTWSDQNERLAEVERRLNQALILMAAMAGRIGREDAAAAFMELRAEGAEESEDWQRRPVPPEQTEPYGDLPLTGESDDEK